MVALLSLLCIAAVFLKAQLAMGGLPIGFDVTTSYLSLLTTEPDIRFQDAIKSYDLLYWLWLKSQHIYHVDPLLFLKIQGVIIPTLLAVSFLFCISRIIPRDIRVWAAPLGTILFSFQISTLTLTWHFYRNCFALSFALFGIGLLLSLPTLRNRSKKVAALVVALFCFAIVFASHQIVSFLVVLGVAIALLSVLVKRFLPGFQKYLPLVFPAFFICSSPFVSVHGFTLRSIQTVSNSLSGELFWLLSASIFPLAVLGWFRYRSTTLRTLTVCLMAIGLSPLFLGDNPFFLWDRWMYFLCVPFSIYAIFGLTWIVERRHPAYLGFALVCYVLAIVPGLNLLRSAQPRPEPYPKSTGEVFAYVPKQYLWNSIGFEKRQDLENAASVLVRNYDGTSPIYMSHQYDGFGHYFLPESLWPYIRVNFTGHIQPEWSAPEPRYYIFGVNYAHFAEGPILPGSPAMQPVRLYQRSLLEAPTSAQP